MGRVDAGRQAGRARGDHDLARATLAREPGQRAGFGEGERGVAAGAPALAIDHVAAEAPGRHQQDLAFLEMRRQRMGEIDLGEGRHRHDQELGVAHGGAEIGGRAHQPHLARARGVAQGQRLLVEHRPEGGRVAPPQPHRVPLLRQIGSSRVRPVAAPQNRNLQNRSLRFPAPR